MVSIAETVIDEDAVMVKFLDTFIAKIAVFWLLRSQSLARHTDIVEVIVFFNQFEQELLKVRLCLHIARIDHSQAIEHHRHAEEHSRADEEHLLWLILLIVEPVLYASKAKECDYEQIEEQSADLAVFISGHFLDRSRHPQESLTCRRCQNVL